MPSAGYKYLPLGICVTRVARKNGRGGTQKRGRLVKKTCPFRIKRVAKTYQPMYLERVLPRLPLRVSRYARVAVLVTRVSLRSLRVCRRLRPLLDLLLPLLRAADLLS